jgi:diguanylate cyclase (GGDEF)-like protein/PAS domain S-box-containing protein
MIALLVVLAAVAIALAVLVTRALGAAREAEARYRTLAESSPQSALMVLDRDRRVVRFEGLAFERQGWREGELVGRPLAEVIPAERMAALGPYLEAALRGESGEFDWRSLRSEAVFRTDAVPFRSRGGAIDQVMLVIRDVTAERALQASVEEQGRFFSAVLAEAAGRLQVCDADGRLLSFVVDPTGLHPVLGEEMHPLEWAERFGLMHMDGTPFGPHETPLLRALRGEYVTDVEFRIPLADGEHSMVASGGPVQAADGRLLGAVVTMADLTARYVAEAQLRRSEERHRRVVESMSDCVFETDARARWTYLNDAWEQATGFGVAESLGRPAWSFVHPDDRAEHARTFAPLLRGEQPAVRLSHRFLTVAGAVRWADVEARAVTGWDGLPTGFVGVMRDITAEKRSERYSAAERAIVAVLNEADELSDVAGPALGALCRELGWEAGELWTMGDDERVRRRAAWTQAEGFDDFLAVGAGHAFEVGDGLPGQAWLAHEPLWRDAAGGGAEPPRSAAAGIRSSVALPLRLDGSTLGVVTLVSCTPREREPGLARLLETVTAHVAQFLHRRAAEHRAAERAEDLSALARVAHELASQNDMYAARNELCAAVRDVTGASSVVLWEPGKAPDTLAVTAGVGAAVRGMTLDLGHVNAAGAAYLTCDPVFVRDVPADPRVSLNWYDVTGAVTGAWFPAVHDNRCVGVIAVGWPQARAELSARDEELLRLLAAEAAVTIHRTALLDRLRETARTDALTGLPNRRVWEEDLARELARAARHGGSLCLVMLDLDRFKTFNDAHGHPAGDRLLADTARAWRPIMRETDTLARYGGEEFAALLPHSEHAGAAAVVERLLAAVPLGQTASAGIAVWDGQESAEALLARADAALYEAKNAGRSRAVTAA